MPKIIIITINPAISSSQVIGSSPGSSGKNISYIASKDIHNEGIPNNSRKNFDLKILPFFSFSLLNFNTSQ